MPLCGKPLIAIVGITEVRLFSRVYSHVSLEISFLVKRFATFLTLKRFNPFVIQGVNLQSGPFVENFVTSWKWAFKTSVFFMRYHVVIQMTFRHKTLWAVFDWARKWSYIDMNFRMIQQSANVLISFSTFFLTLDFLEMKNFWILTALF